MGVVERTGTRAPRRFEERVDEGTGERYLAVARRGLALCEDPLLNKGTCFTPEERDALGLRGVVPPGVAVPGEQEIRAWENYLRAGDDIARYLFLAGLHDRNETLFYRLLLDHLEDTIPIVYTPTVGKVCERYSHIYRRPRGLYVSSEDRGRIRDVLRNAEVDDCRVMVATDNEAILGIGDQGVGGMGIAVGKLALYTAGAGIHPATTLPIDLDVGTDNPALLQDPLYLGVRHPRLRGESYRSFMDEFVEAVIEVFPGALLQWEDLANQNAFEVLDRYRERLPSFNDDIQGTGAMVTAGIRHALRVVGRELAGERMVFLGAGASGAGCALAVRAAMRAAGVPERELGGRVLCLDSQGLILADRPGLDGHKRRIAADPARVSGWSPARPGRFTLADVVREFRPTVLVGASGQPSAFTEEIVRAMRAGCERPVILPLSNPTQKTEARPEDLLRWTDGAAVVGTGSPFPPVTFGHRTIPIGQGNNALVFPGIGLGAIAVRARALPDAAFAAAADALVESLASGTRPDDPIFPPIAQVRTLSRRVALTVGRALVTAGAAPPASETEIEARIASLVWEPAYRPYRPA